MLEAYSEPPIAPSALCMDFAANLSAILDAALERAAFRRDLPEQERRQQVADFDAIVRAVFTEAAAATDDRSRGRGRLYYTCKLSAANGESQLYTLVLMRPDNTTRSLHFDLNASEGYVHWQFSWGQEPAVWGWARYLYVWDLEDPFTFLEDVVLDLADSLADSEHLDDGDFVETGRRPRFTGERRYPWTRPRFR